MSEWASCHYIQSSSFIKKLTITFSSCFSFQQLGTPMAPPGTRVVAHTLECRLQHTDEFAGTSVPHYNIVSTSLIPWLKSMFWKDSVSKITNDDYLKQNAEDMLHLLSAKPPSRNQASLTFDSPILYAYSHIAQILGCAVATPKQ
jgi:hypothetical protein